MLILKNCLESLRVEGNLFSLRFLKYMSNISSKINFTALSNKVSQQFIVLTIFKKSRVIFGALLFFMFVTSCSHRDMTQDGKVTLRGPKSKNFTFTVSEEYIQAHKNSKISNKDPKLTEAEFDLLINLLDHKQYCVNDQGKVFFRITSKQEKVYDMTFAHLIEQNYNARPVMPAMYYGECLNRPFNKKELNDRLVKEAKTEIGVQ